MTTSTDAIICFGMTFDEDREFPWDDDDDDIEEWWLNTIGYKKPFELFDKDGDYVDGMKPSMTKIREYYEKREEFLKKFPIPVKLVVHCSDECPMYIISVPGTTIIAKRGDPKCIDPSKLVVPAEKIEPVVEFIKKYLDIDEVVMNWYLASYWGHS